MAITVENLKEFYKCTTDEQLLDFIPVSRVSLWKWKTHGIPYARQCEFQIQTKGKLKADKEQLAG